MRKPFFAFAFWIILFSSLLFSQTVTGKLFDQEGSGLSGVQLQLFVNQVEYNTAFLSDGSFTFNNVTAVKIGNELPNGYSVSNNFPNPFNPKTRIDITLPNSGKVIINIYNTLGQKVINEISKYYNAGFNSVDIDLEGLPNGIYIARFSLDDKYVTVKKMILLYGSQHLSTSSGTTLKTSSNSDILTKSTLDLKIDSLVATSSSIGRKTFINLPNITGNTLNLGNLTINLPPLIPTLVLPLDNAVNISVQPSLSWNSSMYATSYKLQVATDSLFSISSILINQLVGNTNSYQISGLNYAASYYWKVEASNSYGSSGWSSFRSFSTEGLTPPTVTTSSISNITSSSATGGGNVTTQGSSTVTARGVCWGTSQNPTTSDSKTNDGTGTGSFASSITPLIASTTYYVRAYATNSTGTSYGDQVSLKTSDSIIVTYCPGSAITYLGKTYYTVQIGSQCWLKENLDVGTMIQGSQEQTNNNILEKYCYNNDSANCTTYGGLYQWGELVQYQDGASNSSNPTPDFSGNVKGICPSGWHIPTHAEFQTLLNTAGGYNALKEVGQGIGGGAGTNTSGFSALLAGSRNTS